MPSTNPTNDDDVSPEPVTPRKASGGKKGNDAPKTPTTSKKAPAEPTTPKSAPVAGAKQASHQRNRSSSSKKPIEPPTLLADFLKGRPSQARIEAERKRQKSIEAVKAELRHEMKEGAVRRVEPPGGVKDRVKAWQKSNAKAMVAGQPDDAATEPPDVAFDGEELESVTEEDRIRIKMRQKRKNGLKVKPPVSNGEEKDPEKENAPAEDEPSKPPPKKRVISDEHWVTDRHRGKKSPPRRVSPKVQKPSPASGGGDPIPKDFLQRTAQNPTVSTKIKDWAAKVEVPDEPPPRSYRSSKSRERSTKAEDTEAEARSERASTASQSTTKQTLRRRDPSTKLADDGIRVKPIRRKKLDDDGIRVTAIETPTKDDGIRVRASSIVSSEAVTSQTASSLPTRRRSKTMPSRKPKESVSDRIEVTEDPSELSQTTRVTKSEEPDTIHVTVDPESEQETPTRRKVSKSRSNARQRPASYHPEHRKKTRDDSSWIDEGASDLHGSQILGSDLASSLANKSIADLPGEIPWGHSAFSELDLSMDGVARTRAKRPKVDRNSSLKGIGVFKKVMEEGKKIIQDINEPPKQPGENKPPSIEKWLNNTVDPFVEKSNVDASSTKEPVKDSTPERKKEPTPEPAKREPDESGSPKDARMRRRTSHETKASRSSVTKESTDVDASSLTPTRSARSSPKATPEPAADPETPSKSATPTSGGLKRSKATRNSASPVKPTGKRPFLGFLKEAFQGESGEFTKKPVSYQSQEERRYEQYDDDDEYFTDDRTVSDLRSRSSYVTGDALTNSEVSSSAQSEPPAQKFAGPRFRPPTNGNHELSTIMSEEDSSVTDSDLASDLSHSTLTQSTVLTKDSNPSRTKSQNQGQAPGLKRRLTKHSDLVSVLSLPDGNDIPNTITSSRSRPSLRKTRGYAGDVTHEELLREFADDEGLYSRELKTLVDGVVPVLLSQVLNGANPTELFGQGNNGRKVDGLSKSVVNMGVSLEKLRTAHKKAPLNDLRKLAHWAHGVVPIYNSYLSSWRLGFQDLVVNLAPASGVPDDEDSLLNAMPRNENGDIVNSEGQRVDVAHLLKRPLIRVKQLAKFMKCVDSMISSEDTRELLKNFEELHEKARRRHREETARLTDEDAANTDTTRSRDFRTLAAIDSVTIDPQRQVSAKDTFSLDLAHSNGQRLECQVELVHRDNPRHDNDSGDLLIRETGDGRRTYLLFPPINMSSVSARTGEGNFDMVMMVRGWYHGKQWHELLTVTSDSEDQILDWLDILPVTPVPPREPEPSVVGDPDDEPSPKPKLPDVPVGVSRMQRRHSKSISADVPPSSTTTPTKRSLPTRYHPRGSPLPTTPPRNADAEPPLDKTPVQDDYQPRARDPEKSRPLDESMRPDPLRLTKNNSHTRGYRDDGAPPPPIHRTLSPIPQSEVSSAEPTAPALSPPTEKASSSKVKRRTSSPLKHEYLPSDGSSQSGRSGTDETVSESDTDSSDDEIESVDIPETELGVSLKKGPPRDLPPVVESVLDSECSLTPSNSASQAGLHGHKTAPEDNAGRFMASISRWSDKGGTWKDIVGAPCAVIVRPGLIEAYPFNMSQEHRDKPLLALDLTPLVLVRQSTALDLEIRSSIQAHCQLSDEHGGGNFRFRCHNGPDCFNLYMAVHQARLNNQKFIQLENEARFKSFGERPGTAENDGDTSSRRRSWFGRKNSYRGSTRAPSQSHDGASTTPSSSISASSFLKRLTVAGNLSFNIAGSSVDKQSRAGSIRNSLYTSGSSSASGTPPRSPSISVENSGRTPLALDSENIRIRLHLLVSAAKWEDYGNCTLQVRRPPPGWHQALRADHGLEKRVTVTTMPKKDSDKPKIALDAVLGSGCFTPMGTRGIVCGVWEEVRDSDGVVGMVSATGATGGNIKKWCFQCASTAEAAWVLRLLHQEVLRA